MSFKKGTAVVVIYPATQINGARIFRGEVIRVSGPKEAPLIQVAPFGAGMIGHLNFRGSGKGLDNEAFIVDRSFVEFALKG
jgi:hypothetical protein